MNWSEKLPNFGIKEKMLGIAYTKSLEVKSQFDSHFWLELRTIPSRIYASSSDKFILVRSGR